VLLVLAVLACVLVASGCRNWNNPYDPKNLPANRPPNVPFGPWPDSGAVGLNTEAMLFWNGGDPDTWDVVKYALHFGTEAQPPLLVSGLDSTGHTVSGLSFLTAYHWQVKAYDLAGESAVGPVWSFLTRDESQVNRPPFVPSEPRPENGSSGLDTSTVLAWTGGDPDSGDVVLYNVHFGISSPPPLARAGLGVTTYDPGALGFSTQYFWRIVARDRAGDSAAGPVWSFSTRAPSDTNRAPFAPSNPAPESGATGVAPRVALAWTGGDPDPGDTSFYDVYFGTTSSPPRVSENQRPATWEPPTLQYGTDYYWRIVARDKKGKETQGQLWRFRTIGEVVVSSPGPGTRWREGSAQTVEWSGGEKGMAEDRGRDGRERPTLRVQGFRSRTPNPELRPRGLHALRPVSDSTVIFYSTDGGTGWMRHGRAAEQGRYEWSVPGPATSQARLEVRVYVSGSEVSGTSAVYEVYDSLAPTPVEVTAPEAGARWNIGSTKVVRWTGGTDGLDTAVVYYSRDAGASWTRQGRATAAGEFAWPVPGPEAESAMVQVRAYCAGHVTTGTSGLFFVSPQFPDTVVATVPVGRGPRALAWNSTLDRVYASCRDSDTVAVISGSSNSVVARVRTGSGPGALLFNAATNRLYVANENGASVTVIDGATNAVRRTVTVGSTPRALALNAAGAKVYCANWGSNTVSVIDASSDSVRRTIGTGARPTALCWNRTANKVYVACAAVNQVTVIDGVTDSIVAVIPVASGPVALAVDTAANKVYVATPGASRVTVIDGATNTTWTVITVNRGPSAFALNPAWRRLYVAGRDADSVSVISTQSYTLVASAAAGDEPSALAWIPGPKTVYAANTASDDVAVIGGDSNRREATIAVGGEPVALEWSETSRKVYVANYASGTVTVIGIRGFRAR